MRKSLAVALAALAFAACAKKIDAYPPSVQVMDIAPILDKKGVQVVQNGRPAFSYMPFCSVRGDAAKKLWSKHATAFALEDWSNFTPDLAYRQITLVRDKERRVTLRSRHASVYESAGSVDADGLAKRKAFDALAADCAKLELAYNSSLHIDAWVYLLPLMILFGLGFGSLRGRWEDERTRDAYPAALKISRWAGVLFGAVVMGIMLFTSNFNQRLGIILFMGIFVWTPVLGAVFCWIMRPLIYAAAYVYYRKRG